MEQANATNTDDRKTWIKAIFIWVFLCIWLTGMTAGLMAGACRQDRYEGEKKLRLCNISLIAAAPFKIFPIERAKGSIIHLERGIALAQISRDKDAVDAFGQAIEGSRAKQGSWERRLHRRISLVEDERILSLWLSALMTAGRP